MGEKGLFQGRWHDGGQMNVGEARVNVEVGDAKVFTAEFHPIEQENAQEGTVIQAQRDDVVGPCDQGEGATFLHARVWNEHRQERSHDDFVRLEEEQAARFHALFQVLVDFHRRGL